MIRAASATNECGIRYKNGPLAGQLDDNIDVVNVSEVFKVGVSDEVK